MADELIEVKVADEHTRNVFPVGDQTVTKNEPVEVPADNYSVKSGLEAGTLERVDDGKFQEDGEHDRGGEEGPQDDENSGEEEEPEDESSGSDTVDDYSYSELQDMASGNPDVPGNLPKDELFNRLQEEGEV